MRNPRPLDFFLLTLLGLIWASAFFNIKIATYSYGPITIAFLRVLFGAIPLLFICFLRRIQIEAFSKDWPWFAAIGLINLVLPFILISHGIKNLQSNLAALLMASTPLSATILGHLFTKNEKLNLLKAIGVLIGFCGIIYLFTDKILFNENNIWSALIILLASTCYVVGGVLTLKITDKSNENVTTSILIWATILLLPLSLFFEQPWNLTPRLDSTIALIYLGCFATGVAWLLRFYILKNNGLVFQAQVAYLIPIFGVILGYLFLDELITSKVIISLFAVMFGIYIVKKGNKFKAV